SKWAARRWRRPKVTTAASVRNQPRPTRPQTRRIGIRAAITNVTTVTTAAATTPPTRYRTPRGPPSHVGLSPSTPSSHRRSPAIARSSSVTLSLSSPIPPARPATCPLLVLLLPLHGLRRLRLGLAFGGRNRRGFVVRGRRGRRLGGVTGTLVQDDRLGDAGLA